MLSRRVSDFRYCYGDLADICYEDAKDSDTLYCRDEYDNAVQKSDSLNEIGCEQEEKAMIFLCALLCNIAACIVSAPYMLLCSAIRAYVLRITVDETLVSHQDKRLISPVVVLKEGRRAAAEYEEDVPIAVPYSIDEIDKESFEEAQPLVK
mmetsp:Transcript_787/g.1527  ORF Transcript_787/g.1527 Transcript_787/m.1527 type:complete len:151 (-) Transcript_787:3858-4310(-)